jgi:hypothetical protein
VRSPHEQALPLILTHGWPEKEMPRPSRRWAAKRYTDIRHWGEPKRGGHFAAFEQPELFVKEARTFFRLVR